MGFLEAEGRPISMFAAGNVLVAELNRPHTENLRRHIRFVADNRNPNMKKITVLRRPWSALIAVCGLFVFTAVCNAGARKDAYVDDGSGQGSIYVGSVWYNYPTNGGQVRGVQFNNYNDANAWLDYFSGQGYDVYYDQSSGGGGCFNGCYNREEEEWAMNPVVAQAMHTLSATLPATSVAVSDTAYVFSFGNEATEVGTAVYAKVGGYDNVMRYVSHFFSTTAEAEAYLQQRANEHAIIIYPVVEQLVQ